MSKVHSPIVRTVLIFGWLLLTKTFLLAQSSEKIKTKNGELTLKRSEDLRFEVKFENQVLFESEVEYGSVEHVFPVKNPTLVVLSIGEFALACAASFYVVDLSNSKPKMTEAFGNCNPAPKVNYQNKILTIKFPDGRKDQGSYKYGAAQTWQYANGKLKRIK